MSNNTLAMSVRGLSKSYTIKHNQAKATTAAEAIMHRLRKPLNRTEQETFWALRDVNFELYEGEVVAIIGRNGAGKSTLLKVLSQITDPTTGVIDIYGRIGSLLEVGTGFHPELTGRENIFLNGSILSMRRREIESRFDEIVEFAGIEKFLDTPVKRYSSGMYVRLAFAVAANLTSEILIVDEVLAVGDAQFQRKCLAKMQDVASAGRTVLFVSHNMGVVQSLCQRGIMLQQGSVIADGTVNEVVGAYMRSLEQLGESSIAERSDRKGAGSVVLCDIQISTGDELDSPTLATGRPARFVFCLSKAVPNLTLRFSILDGHGNLAAHFNSAVQTDEDAYNSQYGASVTCLIDEFLLAPGRYRVNVQLIVGNDVQDHVESAKTFDVEIGDVRGRIMSAHTGYGMVCLPHWWQVGTES